MALRLLLARSEFDEFFTERIIKIDEGKIFVIEIEAVISTGTGERG